MAESFEAAVLKIQKEKKSRKRFFLWLWLGIMYLVLTDIIEIGTIIRRFDVTLSEMVVVGDFFIGDLSQTVQYPGYLVAASIRLRFLIFKMIVGIIVTGVFWDYFKCQDLALKLFESMPKGENGIKKPDG